MANDITVTFGGKGSESVAMTHQALEHMREQLSRSYANIDPWCPSHGRSYSDCAKAEAVSG